jgi:hypothetical protein
MTGSQPAKCAASAAGSPGADLGQLLGLLIHHDVDPGPRQRGYLDTVWNAVETAEQANLSLLPALILRSQRVRAAKKQ